MAATTNGSRIGGSLVIPEGWLPSAKNVARPEDDGGITRSTTQIRVFGQVVGFRPEPERFYHYLIPVSRRKTWDFSQPARPEAPKRKEIHRGAAGQSSMCKTVQRLRQALQERGIPAPQLDAGKPATGAAARAATSIGKGLPGHFGCSALPNILQD
jgi:hypothetical protein